LTEGVKAGMRRRLTTMIISRAKLVVRERDGKAFLYRLAPQVEVVTGKALNLGCCVLSFNQNLEYL
ncbi:hypothetical protein, partial [Nostoc sp. JL23]|uniref:hypothetical protein n=1 Tax=Nostoc sp. JL23 TaxID=2815394 RepID=UPI0025FC8CA7